MKTIDTSTLNQDSRLDKFTDDCVYNGLDCCVTHEVFSVIRQQLDSVTSSTYKFSMSLCAPILEINMRGIKIDRAEVERSIASYQSDIDRLRQNLDRILKEGVGFTQPWYGKGGMDSRQALITLFYEVMKLPMVRKRNANGTYTPTVNRAALEKLGGYTIAEPIVNHILAMRDLGKKISFLRTNIDPDGRIRTQLNIAGTNTGRLASSLSAYGTGTNLQNIERRLRRVFVPDPGSKFCNIDLEQADARNVGAIIYDLFNDRKYLDACSSGDLHTAVCRMAWTSLPWTGDLKSDRRIADTIAYRDLSYRDLAKKLGHGTNYLGTPPTMAMHTKVPIKQIKEFQDAYFTAFPGIKLWHEWVRNKLRADGTITTLFGRRRRFFSRADDESTIREAVAYNPQSSTADEIDALLLNIWRDGRVQLLNQVHDSILFQYPAEHESEIIPRVLKLNLPIKIRDVEFVVPCEAKVGWNWADVEYDREGNVVGNPYGLVKYKGNDKRESPVVVNLMDRLVY